MQESIQREGDIASSFHICVCGGHAIRAELLDWTRFGGELKEIVISLWGYADEGKPGRLQQLWHVLRHGEPYVAAVCLDIDDVKKLADELNRMANL